MIKTGILSDDGSVGWYTISDIPMLRMNFDASTAASVTDISKSVFSIYPNPSNGLVYIDLDVTKEYDVFVYNALGQLVLETAINNNANIDLSSFDKGNLYC